MLVLLLAPLYSRLCDLSDCFCPLTTHILKRTAETALPSTTSMFVLAVHDYHCTFPRKYTKPHETTTKPVTKPLVFYRQLYETTFLKKKMFLVHINNIYRIHRFRGKCGKNRVVSWVVSWWFRVVSMWVCVYVYVCMCVCVYVCMCACAYVCMCVCVYVCKRACVKVIKIFFQRVSASALP